MKRSLIQPTLRRQCIVSTLDDAIHDFLFALQVSCDLNRGIQVIVNGQNVAELSDGLNGEPYTEDGWYARYSSFGENGEK